MKQNTLLTILGILAGAVVLMWLFGAFKRKNGRNGNGTQTLTITSTNGEPSGLAERCKNVICSGRDDGFTKSGLWNPQCCYGGSSARQAGACGDKAGESCGTNCWYVNTPNGCECKCDKASEGVDISASVYQRQAAAKCSGEDCSSLAGLPSGSCYQVNKNGQCRCHCFSSRLPSDYVVS